MIVNHTLFWTFFFNLNIYGKKRYLKLEKGISLPAQTTCSCSTETAEIGQMQISS